MNSKRKGAGGFRECIREFQRADLKKKGRMIGKAILIFLILYIIAGTIIGSVFIAPMKSMFEEDPRPGIYYGTLTPDGAVTALFVIAVLTGFFVLKYAPQSDKRNRAEIQDDRGVSRMDKGIHGTAQLMNEDMIEKVFEVNGAGDSSNIIYGQLSENGEKVVRYHPLPYGGDLRNILVVGPPGSQKSRCFVRPELYNSVKRGESSVTTDPSGELFTTYGRWIPKQTAADGRAYTVRVLNFNNYNFSDAWNCLEETIDPATGRLDDTRLSTFVNVFIENCDEGAEKNPYWHEQGVGYLKAAIGYTAWKHENYIMARLRQIYLKVAEKLPEKDIRSQSFEGLQSLKWCEKEIYDAAEQNGYPAEEISALISDIEKTAPPYTIEQVHKNVQEFETAEKELKSRSIPDEQPGKRAYRNVTKEGQSENAKASGIIGTLGKLSLFTDKKLTYNLSRDGIHIADINKKPTVIFLCLNDKDTVTTKPLASLFFTFLFMNAQSNYDEAQQLADEEGETNPILDTNIIIDDFFSVGVIGGSPENFTSYMSNSRKRHIFVSMIIQSISQIPSLYGKENFHTIIADTDIALLFKAGDQDTKEYFSKESGVMTVMAETHSVYQGLMEKPSRTVNISSASRPLFTPDEIGTLEQDRLLLFKDGYRPLKLLKFPYTLLPEVKEGLIRPIAIRNAILPYEEKVMAEKKQENTIDTGFSERISRLEPLFLFDEDGSAADTVAVRAKGSALSEEDTNSSCQAIESWEPDRPESEQPQEMHAESDPEADSLVQQPPKKNRKREAKTETGTGAAGRKKKSGMKIGFAAPAAETYTQSELY